MLFMTILIFAEVYPMTRTEDIHQPTPMIFAQVGDSVTLQCFYPKDKATYLTWYKQPVGQKPLLVSTVYKYENHAIFYNEFKDNPRFSVQASVGIVHLQISNIELSDSATYYCGKLNVNAMSFGEGTLLITGTKSNNRTMIQQTVSHPVQSGDSVGVNCIIDNETCAGEHSVYWFRHGSGESQHGIIYTNGDRSDHCEKSPDAGSPTQSCVYNLPKRNLSLPDAGTYYCAVTTCGRILFGNGTVVDFSAGGAAHVSYFVWLSIIRTGVLFCFLLLITLFYSRRRLDSFFS